MLVTATKTAPLPSVGVSEPKPRPIRKLSLRAPTALQLPAVLWLVSLCFVPAGVLLASSFLTYEGPRVLFDPTMQNYAGLFEDGTFVRILWATVWVSLVTALTCAILAYPVAHYLVRSRSRWRLVVLTLVISPLVASVVVRTYGWLVLLENDGAVSQILQFLGLIDHPVGFRGTYVAIIVGLVHVLLPFSVFTTMSSLQSVDPSLEKAARDLGAGAFTTFMKVTLPLSKSGVLAGVILVFAICLGAFATPHILGGGRVQTLSTLVRDRMVTTLDWGQASAVAIVILVLGLAVVSSLMWIARSRASRPKGGSTR